MEGKNKTFSMFYVQNNELFCVAADNSLKLMKTWKIILVVWFQALPQLPQKMTLASKMVKRDSQIIVLLH